MYELLWSKVINNNKERTVNACEWCPTMTMSNYLKYLNLIADGCCIGIKIRDVVRGKDQSAWAVKISLDET